MSQHKIPEPRTSYIRGVIDAISQDSKASNRPERVADALWSLYGREGGELIGAIDTILADVSWSTDREPYQWLTEVRGHITGKIVGV